MPLRHFVQHTSEWYLKSQTKTMHNVEKKDKVTFRNEKHCEIDMKTTTS